tara:strand:- start:277 stop:837 length:561 start_codon:yes stop_codon:yes gene_type:complete
MAGVEFGAKGVSTVVANAVRFELTGASGLITKYRDTRLGPQTLAFLKRYAPVNNELNTLSPSRGKYSSPTGVIGTYRDELRWERQGNQYQLGLRFVAGAKHSWYVEYGRQQSQKPQYFSWAGAGQTALTQGSSMMRKPGKPYWWLYTSQSDGATTKLTGQGNYLRDGTEQIIRGVLAADNELNNPT